MTDDPVVEPVHDDAPTLTFPNGIVGFPDTRRFVLARWGGDESPFSLLRSLDVEGLAFVVVPPVVFFDRYEPEIDDTTVALLGLEDPADALVLVIVTVPDRVEDATANLLGPIVINIRTNTGAQAVLAPEVWKAREPLRPAAAA